MTAKSNIITINVSENAVNPRLLSLTLHRFLPRDVSIVERAQAGRIELRADDLTAATDFLDNNHIIYTESAA